jgi:DNA topoisomerase-1
MQNGLRYVEDTEPGYTRRRCGRGWGYFDAEGARLADRDEIDRLNRLALPPAYVRTWFCRDPHGHLQATGYDARGRKQYRYHAAYRAHRDAKKFASLAAFGRALPALRAQVERDLRKRGLRRDKAVAAVVRLLDGGEVRVGNDDYARTNGSYGATTLRNRHVVISGHTIALRFKGKSGKIHSFSRADRLLCSAVRRCQDLPGQRLFAYLDDAGDVHPVTSQDVNAYIRAATQADYSAKHFRTWRASVIALGVIAAREEEIIPQKDILEPVSAALGNTPAIARSAYIHPGLLDLAAAPEQRKRMKLPTRRATKYLSATERTLIDILDKLAKRR